MHMPSKKSSKKKFFFKKKKGGNVSRTTLKLSRHILTKASIFAKKVRKFEFRDFINLTFFPSLTCIPLVVVREIRHGFGRPR